MSPRSRLPLAALALLAASALVFPASPLLAQAPALVLVTGPEAPELEVRAAEELAGQLRSIYQAEVSLSSASPAPDASGHFIYLGSPPTNPALAAVAGDAWPDDLSAQGHLLKSVPGPGDRPALVVGGGSPAATYWAAWELAHAFGVRSLPGGDFPPVEAPAFTLEGFDLVLEPRAPIRGWRGLGAGPASQASWTLEDQRRLLRQLAKLKFNHLDLAIHPGQPFIQFQAGGAAKRSSALWEGPPLDVSGDTAGRAAFGGAKVFENPDVPASGSHEDQIAAGVALARGILAEAKSLGMSTRLTLSLEELPEEFSGADPAAAKEAALAACRAAYPEADEIAAAPPAELAQVRLGFAGASALPWHGGEDAADATAAGGGYLVHCPVPGDAALALLSLSRAAFQPEAARGETLASLAAAICGPGTEDALSLGFNAIAEAAALVAEAGPDFASPAAADFIAQLDSAEPAPEWWARAKDLYIQGMNEMYRANTRARDGARPFILYHAKRCTFALHCLSSLEAARAAGNAKAGGDEDAWVEQLELAADSLHSALSIYSEVAADNSDRGIIALLNQHAYRPLLEALDAVP